MDERREKELLNRINGLEAIPNRSPSQSAELVTACHELARLYGRFVKFVNAQRWYMKAIGEQTLTLPSASEDRWGYIAHVRQLAKLRGEYGNMLRLGLCDYEKARIEYDQEILLLESIPEDGDQELRAELAGAYGGLGMCLSALEENAEAEEAFAHSLELKKGLDRLPREKYLSGLNNSFAAIGNHYMRTDRPEKAERCYIEAAETSVKLFEIDPVKYLSSACYCCDQLGKCELELDTPDDVLPLLELAVQAIEPSLKPGVVNGSFNSLVTTIAELFDRLGDAKKAEEYRAKKTKLSN